MIKDFLTHNIALFKALRFSQSLIYIYIIIFEWFKYYYGSQEEIQRVGVKEMKQITDKICMLSNDYKWNFTAFQFELMLLKCIDLESTKRLKK